jgi:xanthine dehydrogenase YagR molybdenum-binding subunit
VHSSWPQKLLKDFFFLENIMAQEANSGPAIIGTAVPRVDGPLKVSGGAKYTSDFHFPGMVYAVPASSTIAKGRITRIDSSEAEKMPGVLAILTREI